MTLDEKGHTYSKEDQEKADKGDYKQAENLISAKRYFFTTHPPAPI